MNDTELDTIKNDTKQKKFNGVSVTTMLLSIGTLLLLLCAIFWPFAFIWALNTLFEFTIEYTFWNWLACWILIFTFQGAINIKREKTK
jgi:hypothetical protein